VQQSPAYAYGDFHVDIPDLGDKVEAAIEPSPEACGGKITSVDVYFEIRHPHCGDLDIWLRTFDNDVWYEYYLYRVNDLGNQVDIVEKRTSIHKFDGLRATPLNASNRTWYLCAKDLSRRDVGYIDNFKIWVFFDTGGGGPRPTARSILIAGIHITCACRPQISPMPMSMWVSICCLQKESHLKSRLLYGRGSSRLRIGSVLLGYVCWQCILLP